MQIEPDDISPLILASRDNKLSLHKHEGVITCGVQANETFVTCDDMGFVNRWTIGAGLNRTDRL
jgi:hypothetical protein